LQASNANPRSISEEHGDNANGKAHLEITTNHNCMKMNAIDLQGRRTWHAAPAVRRAAGGVGQIPAERSCGEPCNSFYAFFDVLCNERTQHAAKTSNHVAVREYYQKKGSRQALNNGERGDPSETDSMCLPFCHCQDSNLEMTTHTAACSTAPTYIPKAQLDITAGHMKRNAIDLQKRQACHVAPAIRKRAANVVVGQTPAAGITLFRSLLVAYVVFHDEIQDACCTTD
jgi:hypothetical protein